MQGYGVSVPLRGWYCLPEYTSALRFSFRPPYEDGTDIESALDYLTGFSPPYGDGTLNISQNIVKWKN